MKVIVKIRRKYRTEETAIASECSLSPSPVTDASHSVQSRG